MVHVRALPPSFIAVRPPPSTSTSLDFSPCCHLPLSSTTSFTTTAMFRNLIVRCNTKRQRDIDLQNSRCFASRRLEIANAKSAEFAFLERETRHVISQVVIQRRARRDRELGGTDSPRGIFEGRESPLETRKG